MIQFNKTSIMAIQVFATRREVNIVSACAESIVRFRLIGLNRSEKLLWGKKLASVPCEWFLRKTGDYVYLCDIDSNEIAKKLGRLLKDVSIPFEYGICISLVTDRGRDTVRLAPFVSEFYRSIGGTVDFSVVSGKLRKRAKFKGKKHHEVNIVSGKAESTVAFHMEGLNRAERMLWEKKLSAIPCEWHYRRKMKSYECLCRIESRDTADRLGMLLDGCSIPADHGLRVSLVTYRDNDGLRLGEFVADFYRRIGGSMEFSIESGL